MKTKANFTALTPLQNCTCHHGAMLHNNGPSMHTFLFCFVVLVMVTVPERRDGLVMTSTIQNVHSNNQNVWKELNNGWLKFEHCIVTKYSLSGTVFQQN